MKKYLVTYTTYNRECLDHVCFASSETEAMNNTIRELASNGLKYVNMIREL